jgi:hypothetical protein
LLLSAPTRESGRRNPWRFARNADQRLQTALRFVRDAERHRELLPARRVPRQARRWHR